MKPHIAVTTCFLLTLTTLTVSAAERPAPLPLASFAAPPRIDGALDEAAWHHATELEGWVETWPGDNTPPPRRTRVLLGVDERHLYVGIEANDDTAAVRATLARRDDVLGDDHVRLVFDTFDDHRQAYVVVLNPYGIAQDGVWIEGREVDYSFDLLFEAKGQLGAAGYTLELALPLSSVRGAGGAAGTWGLHVFRRIHHLDDTEVSWRPLERGRARQLEQAGRITGFLERAPERRLEVIPSWTATQDRGAVDGTSSELSASLRLALGPATVVDAAIRPDFAQVEADQPVVTANQRFPLFFAEKRPFFLEGTELFQTPLSLLHTRTVQAPEFALKATTRRGGTSTGVLIARDRRPQAARRTRHADVAVARWQHTLGAAGELGAMATGFRHLGPRRSGVQRRRPVDP